MQTTKKETAYKLRERISKLELQISHCEDIIEKYNKEDPEKFKEKIKRYENLIERMQETLNKLLND